MAAPPSTVQKLSAEFLGTAFLVYIGAGSVAATGAAINPARYFGTVLARNAFGGSVNWGRLPAYWIGEFAGGAVGALAYMGVARVRSDAAPTSLAPDAPDVPADSERPVQEGQHRK